MEVEDGPNLRNAKDGSPIATEGAKRPRNDERGPEAKPPGLWVRRQASVIGGTRDVHGLGPRRRAMHPRRGCKRDRQKKTRQSAKLIAR